MIIEELLMIRLTGTCFDYWMMMDEGRIIMNEVNVVVRLLYWKDRECFWLLKRVEREVELMDPSYISVFIWWSEIVSLE